MEIGVMMRGKLVVFYDSVLYYIHCFFNVVSFPAAQWMTNTGNGKAVLVEDLERKERVVK